MQTTTIERIREVIRYKGLNARSFALAIGFNYSTLHNYITGRRLAVDLDLILKTVTTYDDISPEWLLTGKGSLLRSANENKIDLQSMLAERKQEEEEQEYFHITSSGNKYSENSNGSFKVRAPLIHHNEYARYLTETKEGKQMNSKDWDTIEFIVKGIIPARYLAFEIRGDSMDDGSRQGFLQGDIVLSREASRDDWPQKLSNRNYSYWIIVSNDNIMCKKIVDYDATTGMVTLHSLNPSPEFQDFQLHVDEIRQMFHIVKKTIPTF